MHYLHRDPDPAKVKKLALLRSDGTSLYSTQDIALTKKRYDTYKMDTMIFVI
ncbi:arginine--tRNA ligase [bacterium]|nr:arginine--tRNA ligase [bacterium]